MNTWEGQILPKIPGVMSAALSANPSTGMFRPPVNQTMKVLDRLFFRKEIPLAAARVQEKEQIAKFRAELQPDILRLERFKAVKNDPIKRGFKSLILRPEIKFDGILTFSF